MTSSVFTIKETRTSCAHISCVDLHDKADLIALGSVDNGIRVINSKGKLMSELVSNGGIMGQRLGNVSSLSFHPHWTYLVMGTTDGFVSAYSSHKLKPLEDYGCCVAEGFNDVELPQDLNDGPNAKHSDPQHRCCSSH